MTTHSFVCACCGSKVRKPPDPKSLFHMTAGPVRHNILAALVDVYPGGLRLEQLTLRVYAGAREPPGDGSNSVKVTIQYMRETLWFYGWDITRVGKGAAMATYKLIPIG